MKKYLTYLLIFIINLSVFSETIDKSEAILIGGNFVFGYQHEILDIDFLTNDKENGIYIINFNPEGWCLVSSNKNARPVIGYNETGYFNPKTLNNNAIDWLNNQQQQITNATRNAKWKNEWETLRKGKIPVSKSSNSVDPLLKTNWNQGSGWNRFCPAFSGGPDGKAYVGCVAVSMAQALHNIKYPSRPEGVKSYTLDSYGTVAIDYNKEPAYKWNSMSLEESDDYNAQLLFNCAVAVEMNFSSDGSGAYTYRVPAALQKYFGFSPSVKNYNRFSDEEEWVKLLKEDLQKGNVIIYAGNANDGKAGHAFNIDGYGTNGYFHFNWGWSGKMNGYFSINNVAPGSSDFTKNQSAVIGITVPYWGPTDMTLSNNSITNTSPTGTTVGEITVVDYSENDEFTFEVYGAPLFMQDGYAPAKFYIEDFKLKSKEDLSSSSVSEIATIIVTDSENNTLKKTFEILINQSSSIQDVNSNTLEFYPNPAKEKIKIYHESYKSYCIYDLNGKKTQAGRVINNEINLSLPKGTYIIELYNDIKRSVSLLQIH